MEPRKRSARAGKAAGHPNLLICDERAFIEHLEQALARCAEGRPNALLHLDVARAHDIRETCGARALGALRDLVQTITYNQLGPGVPACLIRDCAMSLLLEDMLPSDAAIRARRLLVSIDDGTFSWHGHPFRLGAHIGLVELGATTTPPEGWLSLAQEACKAAGELGGSGIRAVPLGDDAWRDLERDRDWHDHLAEVI